MLWCRKTFEQNFYVDHCRIFPTQDQLFEFLDARNPMITDSTRWLPFSIEFPSELDVARRLSRHTNTITLFKKTTSIEQTNPSKGKRGRSQAVREDFSLLYGKTPLSAQSRMFLAATVDGIRSILQTISPLQLHLYEIIRESTPCHLYFDVERSRNYVCRQEEIDLDSVSLADEASEDEVVVCPRVKNDILVTTVQFNRIPQIYRAPVSAYETILKSASDIPTCMCPLTCTILPDGAHTKEVLLAELSAFIAKHYAFLQHGNCSKEAFSSIGSIARTVLVMRSEPLGTHATTVQKFSQHYVVNFHRHIFDSGASVGEFVKHFVEYLQRRCQESVEVHRALFYHEMPIVKNLTGCLAETQSCLALPFYPRKCIIDTAVYSRNRVMRCLGSCKLGKDSVLKLESVIRNGKPVHFDHNQLFENFIASLIVAHDWLSPLTVDDRILLHIEGPSSTWKSNLIKLDIAKCAEGGVSIKSRYGLADVEHGIDLSAISQIEACYRDICGCECFTTSIRRLGERYVILSLGGTRYCQNVMREHKSNNVYLIMDLVRKTWVQKCFDPDCSHYRSQPKEF